MNTDQSALPIPAVPQKNRFASDLCLSGAADNFCDRAHRQIWGPTVNNNIYILIQEYSSTEFEKRLIFGIVKFGELGAEIPPF